MFADISGFTALAERLAEAGPAGTETLTRILNDYFGQLIALIEAYGGDIVKFAGDALLALWPALPEEAETDEPLIAAVLRAAHCCLAVRAQLNAYHATDQVQLSLRLALGAGPITALHLGGLHGHWEFLVSGPSR